MSLNYRLVAPPTAEPISLATAKKQCRIDGINHDDDFLLTTQIIPTAREYAENETNRAFLTQTYELYLDSLPYGDYRSTVPIDQRSPWNYSAYWSDLAVRLPRPRLIQVNSFKYIDAAFNLQTLTQSSPTNPTDGGFYVDLTSEPARIVPPPGGTWPITQFYMPGSITVNYDAGSYVFTRTDTISIVASGETFSGTLPYALAQSVALGAIATVKDINGNDLTYTAQALTNTAGDAEELTQIVLSAAPASNKAVVTYQAAIMPPSLNQAMLLVIGHLYEHREEDSEIALKSVPTGFKRLIKNSRFAVSAASNLRSGF